MDKKTVILGTFGTPARKIGKYHSRLTVKVEIEIRQKPEGPELSICGTTGYPGARDIESAGQISEDVRRLLEDPDARLEKPAESIARLLEVWDRWHLNGMRAGCEHQRAQWKTDAEITLVTYEVRRDVRERRRILEKATVEELTTRGTATLTPEEQALMSLEWWRDIVRDASEPPPDPAIYAERTDTLRIGRPSRETKLASWVKPEESPRGLLCKPCPTCGYRYGSSWLYEPLPADVVKFLEDF